MEEKKLYELNSSQNVVKLQCKYTLFKRVINILTSASTDEKIDFDLMKQALNLVIERNDCLRIKFVKKNRKLMQYFASESKIEDVPILTFASKEEFDEFYLQTRKKAIAYMKGKVIEPYFINNYDGKSMVFLKVCHLVLDAYGINIIFKDLFEVYETLKNKTELPASPAKFEDILVSDLKLVQGGDFIEKNKQFFLDFFKDRDMPYYAGIHGKDCEIWQKQQKKNHRAMKMFFVQNDTEAHMIPLNQEIIDKAIKYCEQNKITLPTLLFLACSICTSRINGNVKNLLPIELCNRRGTLIEKKAAGTKVQSLGFYTTVDYDKNFEENLKVFMDEQIQLYRHVGYPDVAFEALLHSKYKYGFLETLYSFMFSFIPYYKPNGVEINFYTNGKFALPVYLAFMFDINTNSINLAFDYQTKIISRQAVEKFHKNYELVLKQILENPTINIADIKVED